MQRSRKVLSWIAGIVLALVVVLLIVVATFDWNRMKPFIGDKVSQAIGRPFAINGELTVDWQRDRSGGWPGSWLPWPEFTARDISIANPEWAAQPRFAHLDALRFRLSLLPRCSPSRFHSTITSSRAWSRAWIPKHCLW